MTSFKKLICFAFLLAAFASCRDKWEEYSELNDPVLAENLMQEIRKNPALSTFSDYLVRTEYDKLLASSKSFTMWAPTNEALQNLDQNIVNDPERLKQFVANHISYQQFFTHVALPEDSRIRTLSGKYIMWDKPASKVNEASITTADKYVGNGVMHIIDAPLLPKMSSWEFLSSSTLSPRQKAFMQSLVYTTFIDSLATQTGVDPVTGRPVYDSLPGKVQRNRFFQQAYDLSNEDSLYTFVMLTDEAFASEHNKFRKFYATSTPDSTDALTSWAIVKDLAFRGIHTLDNLPDTLVSRSRVKVHIDKSAVVRVERTSNGIVYVLNSLNVKPVDKLLPIRVEGEAIIPVRSQVIGSLTAPLPDKAGSVNMRTRRRDDTEIYRDVIAQGHSISGFNIRYRIPNVYAATYQVYWVAVNDFNFVGSPGVLTPFSQRIAFQDASVVSLPYTDVNPHDHERVLLGEYTVERYGSLNAFLVSAMSTNNTVNPLTLDYLELVPVL